MKKVVKRAQSPMKRVVPSHAELAKMSKQELVNQLWGEIQTNIELNAQVCAATQRAPVTPRQFSDEELRKVVNGIGDNWHNNLTNSQVYAMADKYIRPLLATPAPVTTPGRDELREALEKITRVPAMPFPDPGAHSHRVFGERVWKAWLEIQRIAREALAAAKEPRG